MEEKAGKYFAIKLKMCRAHKKLPQNRKNKVSNGQDITLMAKHRCKNTIGMDIMGERRTRTQAMKRS